MTLPWDDFRLVKAIHDRGRLTRAAADLGINHSTAFRRLAGIEAALGVRLFERLRTGYAPTQAGAAMAAAAARMEADVAHFGRAVAGRSAVPEGELRVTTAAAFVPGLLMPLLGRFAARYPAIRLDVVVSEDPLNLARREADVAIRASDAPPPSLVGRRLGRIAWALYAPAGQDPDALRWVMPAEGVGGARFARFVEAQSPPERIALRLNTVLGLCEAVAAGLGRGPLPCLMADARGDLRRLSGPLPELETTLWLLTHEDLRHAARVRAFMDFAAEAIILQRAALEGRGA